MQPPCPAVRELMATLRASVPFLNSTYPEHNGQQFPRLQWRKDGTLNRHDAGLALDIILFANVERERILAENLVWAFADHQSEMQWRSVIYKDVAISGSGVPVHYMQDRRHFTHVHIDWFDYGLYTGTGGTSIPWPPEAHTGGFGAILGPDLQGLSDDWDGGQLASVDLMHLPRIIIGPITATAG